MIMILEDHNYIHQKEKDQQLSKLIYQNLQ